MPLPRPHYAAIPTTIAFFFAMILCTNNFDVEDPKLSEGDRSWLKKNAIVVEIPSEDTWYVKDGQQCKHYPSKVTT